jgi:branched-chain amino acid transport system ATP-binding protein
LLEVSSIDVLYGDSLVLSRVSFEVAEREIVTIIGANGAGKSTLVNAVSGLLHPNSGRIEFLGNSIEKEPPHRVVEKGIVLIPEGRRVFQYMTVLDNLKAAAYLRRAKEKQKESLEKVFEMFPVLSERRTQRAGTLSGGEQQMLAIARGLMECPRLLMLDEPSVGLAPNLVTRVMQSIGDICKLGITILLVEQNAYHALQLADRAYVLESGKITMEGRKEELLENDYVRKAYLGL